ncbi:O-antigen ligase family protein [Aliivibrio fischeri]|uniref:O-antigen ligase family protein n=1 Tax=Aliivibrio fischeri TaxID=668 RepID=UPI001F2A7F5A|nr:O-antigen ligase family protein [Aliivibrio fischeri]MCE7536798.1 hypothetical protein [Aliivibrio fischeri]MCE7560486.1 hypothetical protein [Aliivibrio fischeri]
MKEKSFLYSNAFEKLTVILFFTSICLYFSSVNVILPISILLLCCFFSILLNKAIKLNLIAISLFLVVLINFIYSTLFLNQFSNQANTSFHLLILSTLAFFTKVKVSDRNISYIIFIFASLNLSLFFIALIFPYVKDMVYFKEFSGLLRYKGIFREPSYNAIISSCLFFARLMIPSRNQFIKIMQSILLVLIMMISFSGSGIILFIMAALISMLNVKNKKPLIYMISLSIIMMIFFIPDDFYGYVYNRAARALSGDVDESTFIRFFAPLHFLSVTWSEYTLFGVGLANIQEMILRDPGSFSFLAKYNDNFNTNIDNGFIYWLSGTGFFGFVFLSFFYIFIFITRSTTEFRVLMFHSFILFFTGAFISPVFIYPLLGSYYLDVEGEK